MLSPDADYYPRSCFKLETKHHFQELATLGTVESPDNSSLKIKGKFVWDTGATQSVINENSVNKLGLKTMRIREIHTANGLIEAPIKVVNIVLPNHLRIEKMYLASVDKLESNILALIGMDIISLGAFLVRFDYKKQESSFQFSIPSLKKVNELDFINLCDHENGRIRKKIEKKDPKHPLLKQIPKPQKKLKP